MKTRKPTRRLFFKKLDQLVHDLRYELFDGITTRHYCRVHVLTSTRRGRCWRCLIQEMNLLVERGFRGDAQRPTIQDKSAPPAGESQQLPTQSDGVLLSREVVEKVGKAIAYTLAHFEGLPHSGR